MAGFRPYKPREPGTIHAVISDAWDQAGGLDKAGDLIGRDSKWCHTASDPDVDRRREASLSYQEVRTVTRGGAGVTAFAEDLAILAGGFFVPPPPTGTPEALQKALGAYATESGEALGEIIRRAADGELDQADGKAALKEIDEALKALWQLRALADQAASGRPVR